jgi:predicted lysophospholipase L1 biosynthesis ABC-type transport system permease subunit
MTTWLVVVAVLAGVLVVLAFLQLARSQRQELALREE